MMDETGSELDFGLGDTNDFEAAELRAEKMADQVRRTRARGEEIFAARFSPPPLSNTRFARTEYGEEDGASRGGGG